MIDGAAVAVEIGLDQRRLFLRMLRPARPRPAVHIGLNHQRLLALLFLLLFQQCSLQKTQRKASLTGLQTAATYDGKQWSALHLPQIYGSWQAGDWDVGLLEIFPKIHNQPTAETSSAESSK